MSQTKEKNVKTAAEMYKEGATLGNDVRLLFNLIGKHIETWNKQVNDNVPMENTIYGQDSETLFGMLEKEYLLLETFKKGDIESLKKCLNTVEQLKKIASTITDPDIQAHVMEMIIIYENEIHGEIGETELQRYYEEEYQQELDSLDVMLRKMKEMDSKNNLEEDDLENIKKPNIKDNDGWGIGD